MVCKRKHETSFMQLPLAVDHTYSDYADEKCPSCCRITLPLPNVVPEMPDKVVLQVIIARKYTPSAKQSSQDQTLFIAQCLPEQASKYIPYDNQTYIQILPPFQYPLKGIVCQQVMDK